MDEFINNPTEAQLVVTAFFGGFVAVQIPAWLCYFYERYF